MYPGEILGCHESITKHFVAFLFAICLGTMFAPTASADLTPDCDGHQETKCEFAPAKYIEKPVTKRCKSGFFDPKDGGECWSCPKNTNRTVFAVWSDKACQKHGSVIGGWAKATYKGKAEALGCSKRNTFRDPRNGGECWRCPDHYNRSIHPVTGPLACTVKANLTCDAGLQVKSDARCYDPNAKIARKKVEPCGGLYEFKCEFAHAEYVSKAQGLSCPKGGFFDPRGKCWKCPGDYNRSIHPVDGHLACTAPANKTCEPGLAPNLVSGLCVYSKAAEVETAAKRVLEGYADFIANAIILALDLNESDSIAAGLKNKNGSVEKDVTGLSTYADAQQSAEDKSFKTLSIGLPISANLGIGGTVENGIAIDLKGTNPVQYFGSVDYKFGPALGADLGLNLTFWIAKNNDLAGSSHGFAFGLADAVRGAKSIETIKTILSGKSPGPSPSASITVWFDYDMEFLGVSVTPAASIGVDFGGYIRASTGQAG